MATTAEGNWLLVEKPGAKPYRVFTKPIVRSEQDDRDYRIIQLENGLRATLVHDEKADKAAASLDVAVGHLYDPDDMPGLAHFCEHLLFMGTEKFPQENEYSEVIHYLAKNNGSSNAYTSTSNTNYYFNVSTSALPGALERFAAFFHSPLFSPSCTSRELNAVDSEHKKNHQADMWRIFQLNKHLTRPDHVWSKFGSGSRDSLSKAARELKEQGELGEHVPQANAIATPIPSRKASPAPSSSSETEADGGLVGREIRRRLVEWWSKEYCASRMRLAIVGKGDSTSQKANFHSLILFPSDSLDELADLANTLFSPIPNRGQEALPMIHEHPFGPEQKGTLVSVQTIMSFYAVEISFPLEYQPPFWRYKPINLISHFVGHEGPGSLHSYLKNKHWVTSLSSGPQNLARGFAMFKVTIHLTPDGFANYRSVILATHKYLALLRSTQFEPFHHQEVAKLSTIRFRFAEKKRPDDYATWISEHMAWPIPEDLLLSAPRLTLDWESEADKQEGEAKIMEYLNHFTIENSRAVLMASRSDHLKLQQDLTWDKEPWYGTEYAVQKFEDDFANGVNDIPELFLPGPNEFIPSNLDVEKKEGIEPLKRPHLIRQTRLSSLWHKKDDRFWVPKAHVVIDIRSPSANASARAAVITRLYSNLVNDSLTEFSYDADLAGLSYNFTPHTTGLFVSMNGYNDKMIVLVRHVLEKVKGLVIDPQRLAVIKEEDQARREWENFFLGQSYSLSDYYGRYLMAERHWTVDEKLKELSSITPEDVQAHVKQLLSQVSLRILAAGNMYKDEAIKIAEMAEEGLGASSLSSTELNDRCLILPKGSNFAYSTALPNVNQANSALTYFTYYGPVVDQKLRVTSALLTQIMSEPTFNVLRTREQLGYIVSCSSWTLPGSSEKGVRIVVQSEKKPTHLEGRVEAFLDEMKNKLEEMTDEEFQTHKSGLEKKWLEADKNLGDEVAKFLFHVNTGHFDFLRNEKDAEFLRTVTRNDVFHLFMSQVHPSSTTRAKLSVHMVSQKPRPKSVSRPAAAAFESLVRQAFPDLDDKTWKPYVGDGEPTIIEFGQHWLKALNSDEGKKLLAELPRLVEEHPVDEDHDDGQLSGVTYIKDMKAFKDTLEPSIDPGPMVEWNDLPVPRF
ncbi:Metalloenzyme, LuxS/M16 peptidase-like protein [Gymnopilus junonius]|uniref:Metalloenzyme, LuxS/M16 peptidase-like protein n=1 Tax=Gymnopilus junonius TaxID=109634 RepID=A0A9P5TTM2_GYMJU|nr:Metalloenzyme, LuxS/M16 peptidase-like protein [Gymnopilus junonius]